MNTSLLTICRFLLLMFVVGIFIRPVVMAIGEDTTISEITAAADSGSTDKPVSKEGGIVSAFFRTLLALLLVLAMACLIVWGMKFFQGIPPAHNLPIRVLHRVSLTGRKSIFVVKVAEKALVLGVSEQSITKLCFMNCSDFPDSNGVPLSSAGKFGEMLAEKIKNAVGSRGQ